MRYRVLGLLLLCAASLSAQVPIQRVADDARVIDRVAEATRKDLPVELLKRIINEDIDLLRGKRADGSFRYATFERLEAGRTANDFSVQKRKDEELTRIEMKGSWVYRVNLSLPSRRLLVTRNRRVWVDRVDLEFIPENSSATRTQSVKIDSWMEPGSSTPIDFPVVARQATVRVFARADEDAGYGNIVLTLIHARIVDNVDSPYAAAVSSAKALLRAVENSEIPSIRAMATRLHDTLVGAGAAPVTTIASTGAASEVDVIAPAAASDTTEMHRELEEIEDLLTGTESERRQGLDRLHQLVRKTRPRT